LDATLLLCSWFLLAATEGFQVAALKIQHMDVDADIADKGFTRTALVHALLYPIENGNKFYFQIKRLFVGQSFLVVSCSFMIAELTTFHGFDSEYSFGSNALAVILSSGFPGIFITITTAQMLPSLLAKEYPREFLNLPGIYWLVRFALLIESTGVVYFVYILESSVRKLFRLSSSVRNAPNIKNYIAAPVSEEKHRCQVNYEEEEEITELESLSADDFGEFLSWMKFPDEFVHKIKKNHVSGRQMKLVQSPEYMASTYRLNMTSSQVKEVFDRIQLIGVVGVLKSDLKNARNCNHTPDVETSNFSYYVVFLKYAVSTVLTAVSIAFIMYCLIHGYSTYRAPALVQYLLLSLALIVIFYCEGIKVAIISK